MKRRLSLAIVSLSLLACAGLTQPQPTATPTATPMGGVPIDDDPTEVAPVEDVVADQPTPVPAATATPVGPFGPVSFPDNVNPLTGLIVDDPAMLNHRPILVKVSNESPDVRPQSGLSFSDHVWEYQMEGYGLTRFTAVIYGENPDFVGSVRSARLIDVEHLFDMYGGILVNSGASTNRSAGGPPRINELLFTGHFYARTVSGDFGYSEPYLERIPGIPRDGVSGYHSLFAVPEEIWKLADEKEFNDRPNLDGMLFDYALPANGTPTSEVYIDYPGRGPKHIWRYDADTGLWISYLEDQNRDAPEAQETDYLNSDEPLAFENIVVLYAWHQDADFIEDEHAKLNAVRTDLSGEGDAVLLRDGQRYEIIWRRPDQNSILQFFDLAGNPIAFKPGSTWFNVASWNVALPEVVFTPE